MRSIDFTPVVAILALLAGCGGNVSVSTGGGGAGGGGTGGTTTSTTTTTVPPTCAVPFDTPPPYKTEIQFAGASDQQLFLREECHITYTITSCAEGDYSKPIAIHADCTTECSTSDCIVCDACNLQALPVSVETWQSEIWDGHTYTFGQNSQGCSCHNTFVAPAGKYRVTVDVYPTADDAVNGTNGQPVSKDFDLPAPNDVVTVQVYYGVP